MAKQMALAGFMLSGPVVHSHAVWRHPQTHSHFLDPDYYIEIAKTLEDGCFDLLFFADRLAVGDQAGQSNRPMWRGPSPLWTISPKGAAPGISSPR